MTSNRSPNDSDRSTESTPDRPTEPTPDRSTGSTVDDAAVAAATTEEVDDRSEDSAADAAASTEDGLRLAARPRLSTLRIGLLALALLFVVVGAVVTGSGVVALSGESPAPTADPWSGNAITADGPEDSGHVDRPEISGSFARSVYTGVAGDPIEIRHTANDEDTYLLIGGNRLTDTGESVGFVDVVKTSGSETTINTRTLGTDASNVESCGSSAVECDLEFLDEDGSVVAENLSELSSATGAGGLPRPIVPQRYRLAITNGTFIVEDSGQITPAETAARSELVLEKPTFHDEIEVFTTADRDDLPDADGDDAESLDALERNGVDRTTVTTGDRVVLGFESTGIWGAISHFAEDRSEGPVQSGEAINHTVLTDLLEAEEGVSLHVRQTNPGRNQPRSELDLSNADPDGVSLILADSNEVETGQSTPAPGRFYLVLNTGPEGPFTETPDPGDEFAVEFALEGTEGEQYRFGDTGSPPAAFEPASHSPEQFPYWEESDGRASAEASFSIRERFVRYDHVTNDGTLLVEADEGVVTGTTSILPVTELAADFVNDAGDPIRTQSPLEIDDGNFSVDADFDGVSPGTHLNYELYEGSTFKESRPVVVVNDTDDPDRLEIADAPANVTVAEDGNLSAIEPTVRNAGGLSGDGTLVLDIEDGNVTASQELTLDSNESRHVGFGSVTPALGTGSYSFTLTLDGDERNGTLLIEEDPAKTTLTDSDDDSEESDDDAGPDDVDGSDDADDSDEADSAEPDDEAEESNDDEQPPEEAPATILPFGIGTRETLGGTVLVGATYLLGHWV